MSQEEIFDQVYEKYKNIFPEMLHSSGGLPDTKGVATSDVDISLFHPNHASLAKYFPKDTKIDNSSIDRTIYKLEGYEREVNIYCTDGDWWRNAFLHRQTELALNERYPDLSNKARILKKDLGVSTEMAWAKVLDLDDTYLETLLDVEKVLDIANRVAKPTFSPKA
ncbi:MAG: hypothetical protein A2566_03695 [Candidatus Zambryskibacteria bacterium RIFOXYD1_FULL_40_13]|nr:MAG: hypothetical protein UT25_C0002G0211 [Parcubacteria group bacterium GW2011_GWC1_39_12]KKR19289.1 MAG: hypothetical protein UT49_C0002G0135 [Parcubacteria group bacterium GW2011_GWF1_39_37]KKR35328.1 MAG: hypothetical protein UT68_C0004G0136 [Parcubacteria group bacterium GW2011_GWC2_40_10]KKR52240.1 MAG: hypothetical protein UT89_C0002G0041 [Parcubacteria group bacterium GW2011_GWE1_40_20]KKR65737.1 MAG: hypothetical protein UU06_C0012G0033 [Parcubacteria group bacterium GW2011_GWB1_40_